MTRIAFIGLGNMGGGMAANLAKAGHDVRAFDLSPEALDRAKAAGCLPAASVADAAAGAAVIVTMLPAGHHVETVYAALFAAEIASPMAGRAVWISRASSACCADNAKAIDSSSYSAFPAKAGARERNGKQQSAAPTDHRHHAWAPAFAGDGKRGYA